MPISTHLLERAYELIEANQLENAEMVLDAVVRVDPKNVMAWKAYLQLYQDRNDLKWLIERILKTRELSDKDKEDICAFHDYLIQNLSVYEQNSKEAFPRRMISFEPVDEAPAQDNPVIFELLDEFDYPEHKKERVKSRKPRQIFKYDIPMYVWQAAGLLIIFYAGIRLLVLGYIFGYLLMGAFIVGGVYWLRSINDNKTLTPTNITHAYSLESENELFIIDKPIVNIQPEKNNKNTPRIRYLDE